MGKKQKRPVQRHDLDRVPKTKVVAPSNDDKPIFCFRHADRATTNAWSFEPTESYSQTLLGFICDMAHLTWNEINSHTTGGRERHRKHHSQLIESICSEARADLERSQLEAVLDDDRLFRFRVGGTERLWGFRKDRVFHVVWWDPNHEVYPTEPS